MDTELLENSLDLLLYGMGVVICFLTLLVFLTTFMSRLLNRFFPQPEPDPAAGPELSTEVDELTLKIIQAALDKHRGRQ